MLFPGGDRQNQSRLRLGGALEIVVNPQWNVWGIFEGVILGPSESRRILGDVFGFGAVDTELYGRVGATYRFGAPRLRLSGLRTRLETKQSVW